MLLRLLLREGLLGQQTGILQLRGGCRLRLLLLLLLLLGDLLLLSLIHI